ncbi:MAG: hypothetical protein RSC43_00030 [Clostridia bacterium]
MKQDFFTPEAMEKYNTLMAHQSKFSAGEMRVTAGSNRIRPWKMVSMADSMMIVPMFLHLPFNIVTGEKYSLPQPVLGSVRFAIAMLKLNATRNPKVKDRIVEMFGEDEKEINYNSNEVTSAEYAMFKPLRNQLVYSATVMSVHPANSRFEFGTPYQVQVKYDEEQQQYIDDINNPLIYKLHKLESAALSAIAKDITLKNQEAADNRRTDAEIKETIKNLWKDRCITNPYPLGTERILNFPTDRNYEVSDTIVKAWNGDVRSLTRQEYYIKANKYVIGAFAQFIGGKYDRYEDFLAVKVHVPEFTEDGIGLAAQGISRSGSGIEDAIETNLPKFVETYRAYRDAIENWDESVLKRSVYAYATITDASITNIFKQTMPKLNAALHTQEVFDSYSETIALVDENTRDSILQSAMTEDLTSVGKLDPKMAKQYDVSEDDTGYGGDTLVAEPESVLGEADARAALMSAIVDD